MIDGPCWARGDTSQSLLVCLFSLHLSTISSFLMQFVSVYLCALKWRSRITSISCCLRWRGYETYARTDLCCFGDSFGVEKYPFVPFLPFSAEEVVLHHTGNRELCRRGLCTPLSWGSLRGTGQAVLGLSVNQNNTLWKGGRRW